MSKHDSRRPVGSVQYQNENPNGIVYEYDDTRHEQDDAQELV